MADPGAPPPDEIRAARRRLGLTQVQFAARLGTSAQAVAYWEQGRRTPTGLYLAAVRTALAEAALTPKPPSGDGPPSGR